MSTDDSKLVDLSKPVQTRDGREVKIYTTKGAHKIYLIVGEHLNCGDEWEPTRWRADGTVEPNWPIERSLINVPQQHTVWINVYRGQASMSFHHADKTSANKAFTEGRIACIEVTFQEGEGLE